MNQTVVRVRIAEMLLGIGMAMVLLGAVWIAREFLLPPEKPATIHTKTLSATLLNDPISIPDFNLVDHNNNSFTLGSLRGQWSFLFFGYTHCPDVCPTTMNVLVQTQKQLLQYADLEKPNYIFVSVDPDRDTTDHLAQYMAYFHQDFLGVTGSKDQLETMTRPLGIYYKKDRPEEGQNNYTVGHSNAILLINPEGGVRALVSPPHDAITMANDYRYILSHRGTLN